MLSPGLHRFVITVFLIPQFHRPEDRAAFLLLLRAVDRVRRGFREDFVGCFTLVAPPINPFRFGAARPFRFRHSSNSFWRVVIEFSSFSGTVFWARPDNKIEATFFFAGVSSLVPLLSALGERGKESSSNDSSFTESSLLKFTRLVDFVASC